ncbi:PucC family protein [uncultured Tateyamaria sp.]|uniref:PucC family protein n=1 Tax=uncultured Tateyamaria sp. TaxID=455651 RepID=UPI002605C966|nr:PucC family protein [uncultured Tateyamaria sp.]
MRRPPDAMFKYHAFALNKLSRLAPRYLPFADVATETVPLSRLLRLSLFQVTVGMALVLLVGTLNRVMIVELNVPASLVALMISLPVLFAPLRALVGYKSDTHHSALGLKRFPYIYRGTLLQFGGFAIMPFALLVLSGYQEAADAPRWVGLASAGLAFLLVGAGLHIVQTVGLALATDLVPEQDHPKVVGLMYVMLLFGMVLSALVFGLILENYTPGRLIQCIQGVAVLTVLLNGIALWKQEARVRTPEGHVPAPSPSFSDAWRDFIAQAQVMRLLVLIALGTFAFGMADVVLEPYGGQILHLSVADTTRLTATLALGTLLGFGYAARTMSRGTGPWPVAGLGLAAGIPGFGAIILAAWSDAQVLFVTGVFLTGLGAGLFGHGTLTATLSTAPRSRTGLALGAWGAVQATAAGAGVAFGGVVRDLVRSLQDADSATPYLAVFSSEILILCAALAVILPVIVARARNSDASRYPVSQGTSEGLLFHSAHPTAGHLRREPKRPEGRPAQ